MVVLSTPRKVILVIIVGSGSACEIKNSTINYTVNIGNMVIHKTVLGFLFEVMGS